MRSSCAVLLLISVGWSAPGTSVATSVYKCQAADGRVAYQDLPCAATDAQSRLHLATQPDLSEQPGPAATAADGSANKPITAVAATTRTPLRPLYDCERPDGSRYTSSSGIPVQHLVPLGVLGYPPPSLSDTYGGTRRMRMQRADPSTPAGARAVRNAAVAAMSVWVEDQCRPMGRRQVCEHFEAEYDRVHQARRRAFKDTREQLESEERALRAMLGDNC